MEQPAVASSQEVLWCNYNPDGTTSISSSAHVPLQLDLGNSSIARQISQQMQVQYALNGQGQIVYQVPQPHAHLQQVVVATAGQPTSLAAGTITPIVPQQVIEIPMAHALPEIIQTKPNKPRSGAVNERVHCEMCEKTFSCAANLRDHMRLHTGQKPFKCTECDMEFAQRSNWRLHRRVHTGEKPYMCGICGKTFARSSHLPSHMRIHTGEKPFKCELCHNCFPSSQALKNHTRTHTGEKPFTCIYCETSFTHSSSLSSHKKKCNGVKRKRGRPIGTGRRPTKKKQPSGRPRGRPKKKLRTGRGRKRLNPPAFDDSECLMNTNNRLINRSSTDRDLGLIDTINGSSDTIIGSIDINSSSFDTNVSDLLEEKPVIAAVKTESDVNCISDIERNTTVYEESSDPDMIACNKLCETSSNSLPTVKDKAKLRICQAADDGESSSLSKHPKVAIRESKRLRIKQENRRANLDAMNSVKIEPEILVSYERREGPNESIVVDFECSDETFNSQPVVIEHRMSSDCSESIFSSPNPPCIQINIASGTSGNTSSTIDHQKEVAAITMATLQQEQQLLQQGVLNLTHHQADLRSVQVVDASKDEPQHVLTFVNPLDLQQQNPQHLSSHNMHAVTPTIPLAHSTQNSSTIRKMNIRETYHQTRDQPQHSNEVKDGVKDAFSQQPLSDLAPPAQYVSYQLGDSHVHVPVTLSRSINNLESNW